MIDFSRVLPIAVLTLALAASPALSQYDKDGRYVPSPNGVPSDPTRSAVPMYPGSPGGTTGTAPLPRSAYPELPKTTVPTQPRPYIPPGSDQPRVFLTRDQCDKGWSPDTNVPRVQFNRLCKRMKPRPN